MTAHHPMTGWRPAPRGFSLLEIIVALGIFMVGAASVFSLFAVGAQAHKRAVDMSNAARAAEAIFAELEAKWTVVGDLQKRPTKGGAKGGRKGDHDYPVLASGKPPWSVPGYPEYTYDIQYTPVDEEDNAVMTTVFIHWQRRGQARVETFRRLLLRRPF